MVCYSRNPTHSLLRFLLVSNSLDLILDVVLELWSATIGMSLCCRQQKYFQMQLPAGFVPPYALQEILMGLAVGTPDAVNRAYFWAVVAFVANLSFAQADLFQSWHTRRCYERTRGQMFCLLHYKSLKRRQFGGLVDKDGESRSADLGKIVNLMQYVAWKSISFTRANSFCRGDTYAVAQRFWEFSGICTSPFRIAIALTFLHRLV